ncbi:MAG: IS5 family transposase, partial [Bacteroidia bacterium]
LQKMNRSLANITKEEIETIILPLLPVHKRGFKAKVDLSEVFLCIVHKLKTGYQWRALFVDLPSVSYPFCWQLAYYYYRKWSKLNIFEESFNLMLCIKKDKLNIENLNLDGTHSLVKKAAESRAYQGRKKAVTSNILALTDGNGIPVSFGSVISGNHNDLYHAVKEFSAMVKRLKFCEISVVNSILNADGGFDSKSLRRAIQRRAMISNIKENTRGRKKVKVGRKKQFYDEVYKNRYVNERCFGWMDSFRTLLVRFDTLDCSWKNWHFLAAFLILLKV